MNQSERNLLLWEAERQRLSLWRGIKNALLITAGALIFFAALWGVMFL